MTEKLMRKGMISVDEAEYLALLRLAEANADLVWARNDRRFSLKCGGVRKLNAELQKRLREYLDLIDEDSQ